MAHYKTRPRRSKQRREARRLARTADKTERIVLDGIKLYDFSVKYVVKY